MPPLHPPVLPRPAAGPSSTCDPPGGPPRIMQRTCASEGLLLVALECGKMFKVIKIKPESGILLLCCLLLMPLPLLLLQ